MSDSLVIEGHFWRPNESHRFYGRVEYDADQGLRLHFVDTNLITRGPSGPEGPGVIDVIHGEELGGSPLTLLGFYPSKWSVQGMRRVGDDVVDGVAEQLLRGVHVDREEEVNVGLASSSLQGLREFLIGGTVDGGPLPPPKEELRGETLVAQPAPGVRLLLSVHRLPTFGRIVESSEIRASAQWTCDPPLSLGELEHDYIRPLQELILFATRSQSYVTSLAIQPDPEGSESVQVLQQPYPRPRETPEIYALALNLGDQDQPNSVIESWFHLREKVGPVWGLFFAALDHPESLLEDQLLGLLAFAEGYDRSMRKDKPLTAAEEKLAKKLIREAIADKRIRAVYSSAINHANSPTQRERLDHLIAGSMEALAEWWEIDSDLLSAQLSDTRNWLVHWDRRGKNVVSDSQGMSDLGAA